MLSTSDLQTWINSFPSVRKMRLSPSLFIILPSCMVFDRSLLLLFSQLCPTLCNPHGLQYARLPYPSPSPGVCSNSCPLSRLCHPTIWSCHPFFSCLQSFPASGSFQMSWLFASGDQSIGASASVLPMNIQGWFPLGLFVWCPKDSQEASPTPQFESINSSALSFLYGPILTSLHDYWKNHSFD